MSPLKIIYHYISSVTDIQYVQAVCYQDMFYLEFLTLEGGTDWLSQNVRTELPL
jgi:hypothetical protein